MVTLRIAFVEWPEALSTDHPQWNELKASVTALHPDILITNELPFGPWIAESGVFSAEEARFRIGPFARCTESNTSQPSQGGLRVNGMSAMAQVSTVQK